MKGPYLRVGLEGNGLGQDRFRARLSDHVPFIEGSSVAETLTLDLTGEI